MKKRGNVKMKKIEFVATYGKELAIAKITWENLVQYSVCRGVDYEKKCWDYSLGYYSYFKEASVRYAEKILEIPSNLVETP